MKRVLEHGVQLTGASDHGVSEAVYLHDPDGNGIELYATATGPSGRATPTARSPW